MISDEHIYLLRKKDEFYEKLIWNRTFDEENNCKKKPQ